MVKKKNDSERFIVPGFLASGISSGIKGNKEKDLGLIYSEIPAATAAVFTQNRVKAAPVLLSMGRVKRHLCQAVVVNSGNANACTGKAGLSDAYSTAGQTAQRLGIDEALVMVASTGVIGKRLPVDRIHRNIPKLVEGLTPDGILSAAQAILTTDTQPKVVIRKEVINDKEFTICGIAKGAGMIMPNMATLLSFILTDAAIEAETLENVFKEGIRCSFNRITIDGDTSTNDMAMIMANGKAENPLMTKSSGCVGRFGELLSEVLTKLAMMIVKDGEGATKFVEISVVNAKGESDALRAALNIANSNLVKTAFFGEDCNWGRIVSAVGASGADIDIDKIDVSFDDILVVSKGISTGYEQEERAHRVLEREEFKVVVDLNCGLGKAKVFTTDLSPEYININANYRS